MTWGKGRKWGDPPSLTVPVQGLVKVSPSQIKLVRDCLRKWAFKYILKKADPPGRQAQLGTGIHKVLERYLRTGWLPKGPGQALEIRTPQKTYRWSHDQIVAIVLPGIVHLPAPGIARCEQEFTIPIDDDLLIRGFIDFLYQQDDTVIVGDHKTTSNLQYALTPEDLQQDPQGIIYAVAGMQRFGCSRATDRWIYYRTNRPRSILTECEFSIDTIAEPWQRIVSEARELKELRHTAPHPNTLEANYASCGKYGGCPYESICDRSAGAQLRSLFAMTSPLKERMAAARAAAAQTQTPAPAAGAEGAAAPVASVDPAPSAAPAVGLNPPESAGPLERLAALKAKNAAACAAAAPAAPAQAPVQGATCVDAKKDQTAAQAPATPVAAPAVTPASTSAAAPAAPASVPTQGPAAANRIPGFELYIDCVPNRPWIEFAFYVSPVLAGLKDEYSHDYRLIPDLYGGNGALMAQALALHLVSDPPKRALVAHSADPVVRDCLDVLLRCADLIVRGF
jgi:RecB family exonuclease